MRSSTCGLIVLVLLAITVTVFGKNAKLVEGEHADNWAVLVGTSKYWYNYRHESNPLSFYHMVKKLGIPDHKIILMNAEDAACNPRNPYPGQVFNSKDHSINLYSEDVEVDYRAQDVTVENFIRLLTGRHDDSVPRSKRLLTNEKSNILVYMTGHGGDEFLKFQDFEEISAWDLADAFEQMHRQKRYNQIFMIADTCQAGSFTSRVYSPNILTVGSSLLGENSFSYSNDPDVGIAVIDRFTYFSLEYFETVDPTDRSMADMFNYLTRARLYSHIDYRDELLQHSVHHIPLMDFYAGVTDVILTQKGALRQSPTRDAFYHVGNKTVASHDGDDKDTTNIVTSDHDSMFDIFFSTIADKSVSSRDHGRIVIVALVVASGLAVLLDMSCRARK